MSVVVLQEATPFPWQKLPKVGRAEQLALRRFSPRRPAINATALEEALGCRLSVRSAMQLTYTTASTFPALVAGSSLIELTGNEQTLFVELQPQFALRTLGRAFGFEEALPLAQLTRFLRNTELALEQGALAYLAAVAAKDSGYRLVDIHAHAPGSHAQYSGFFCETFRVAATFSDAAFEGDIRVWHPDHELAAHASHASVADEIEVRFSLERGSLLCPIANLRSLLPGDVVMLDVDTRWPNLTRTLRARTTGLAVHLDDQDRVLGLSFAPHEPSRTHERTNSMNDNLSHSNETAVATLREVDLEALSVTLSFEIAEVSLTVGELRSMRVGQILSTGKLLGERVMIQASGRAIGRGELVNLDGEIGVRVLELKPL